MTETLKETRRQNKLMQMAIDKTSEQNQALDDFFLKCDDEDSHKFDVAYDLPQTTEQFIECTEDAKLEDIAPRI